MNRLSILRHFYILALLLLPCTITAQTRSSAFERYIEQYKEVAVEQMRTHGIPASITLAQGLLESGGGNSELAKKSNNHFGIKCGADWQGPYVTHFDDNRNERFRVYDSPQQSFEDHSKFLLRPRYQRLFRLSILDYKGWARGLKACGYATSPTYADRLISIIELYKLDDLDEDPNAPKFVMPELPAAPKHPRAFHPRTQNNGIPCVIAYSGDTWESLAAETKLSKQRLLDYNEAFEDMEIGDGDIIYLKKKAAKGPAEMKGQWYKIQRGDSMYSIAQKHGMRLNSLYKMNFKADDYTPVEGDLLKVR